MQEATGRQLRDEGIERVLMTEFHWRFMYKRSVGKWFDALPSGYKFSGEQLREAALAADLPAPHHANVWGAMSNVMLREWLITERAKVSGTRQAKNRKCHAHFYREYRKT
jgi:hypothetical protein